MESAEVILLGRTVDVDSETVLQIAETSGCSAYDAEYVTVAKARGILLVTADKQLLKAFPGITAALDEW
jgi:predicted nucleic acid-binding protein